MSKAVIWIATIALIIGGVFMGLGSYFSSRNMPAMPQNPADEVIARVNGDPISRQEYNQALDQYQQQMSMFGGGNNMAGPLASGELHSEALDQTIRGVLELQIAKKRGLSVTDSDIQAERRKWIAQIKEQLGLPANASNDQVQSQLGKVGQSLDTVVPEDRLENAALSDKYTAYIQRLATPSPQQVEDYYTGLHTEHILISNKSRPDAQAQQQAQKIIALLNASKGTNFEALAKQYSDDSGTKAKGGDDGWINGQTGYVDEFMNAARVLKPGQWTQAPVLSPQFGYFIIKLLATRSDKPKDFAAKQADYVKQIASTNAQKLQQQDMDAAQKSMKVTVSDPQIKADYALMTAFRASSSTGQPAADALNAAAKDYQAALATTKDLTATEQMDAQLGIIYRQLNRPADELKAFLAASNAASGSDPDLDAQVGQAYQKLGQTSQAIQYYKMASKYAYDNVGVHMQLAQSFKTLNQPALAAAEQKWIQDYNARQKAASAQSPLGVQPITLKPKK